jgi:membrane-bound lytic murein transglycosylase A
MAHRHLARWIFVCAAALWLLAACAPRAGLVATVPKGQGAASLVDDGDFGGLSEALRWSLQYYSRLPDGATFRYGELLYTAREVEASTRLLLDLVEGKSGTERLAAIREQFLFFESRNDRGGAFFTGYYEPILPGSLAKSDRFPTPLYGPPTDLLTVDIAAFADAGLAPGEWRTKNVRGKVLDGRVVPYDDRGQIAFGGSLEGRAEPIAWVADDVELFFVQVQGSCLLRLEDGSTLRVNYADQNGRPYRSIGKLLLDRIPRERMSLQSLKEYLRRNPDDVRRVLSYNPSYTFFRRVDEGPLGNIEVPLTPRRSVAMDAHLVPRGGVVWLETELPPESVKGAARPTPLRRFGVVQDTGGAITGHGRVDLFWGTGEDAERVAGHFKQEGRVYLVVAKKEDLPK